MSCKPQLAAVELVNLPFQSKRDRVSALHIEQVATAHPFLTGCQVVAEVVVITDAVGVIPGGTDDICHLRIPRRGISGDRHSEESGTQHQSRESEGA